MRRPLLVVGSGGSFSVASYCAGLHRRWAGALATAVTPLNVIGQTAELDTALLCLSAGGSNADIRAAFRHGTHIELRPAIAFTLTAEAPLLALAQAAGYADAVVGPQPAVPDGFLAVNSVVATIVAFARAYRAVAGAQDVFPRNYEEFIRSALVETRLQDVADSVAGWKGKRTISVMYSPVLEAAAVDLESRFVEAALGPLHIADFRNFGHGRHNWLAKRTDETAVLALASEEHSRLADQTLKVLPDAIPSYRVVVHGEADVAGVVGLIVALYAAYGAGQAIGVDPGRPGIPEFGRKLYRLPPPKPLAPSVVDTACLRKRRAIEREGGVAIDRTLIEAHTAFVDHLASARVSGLVLDYDGTLCDMRRRFEPLEPVIGAALQGIVDAGIPFAVATGRGRSVASALRNVIPEKSWDRVFVGYYNGAEGALLTDISAPLGREASPETQAIVAALADVARHEHWNIEARRDQVTVTPAQRGEIASLLAIMYGALARARLAGRIVTSSHSLDILVHGVGKLYCLQAFADRFGIAPEHILRIGDRGAAPGNDADLLQHPLGLSADEVSGDLASCWRLSPPGDVGPAATLSYVRCFEPSGAVLRFKLGKEARR